MDNAKIVVFVLDASRFALYLSSVERVIHAVEVTPFPKAPTIVLGVINLQGAIVPVIDIRKRFLLPVKEISVNDQFIILRTTKRLLAFAVDSVEDVVNLQRDQVVAAEEVFPFADFIAGIAKTEKRLVLINDVEKFLSLDEEEELTKALNG